MPQANAFFQAGLKIVGVLTMIWGITHVIPVIFQFYSVYNQPDMMTGTDLSYYRFSLIFQVVYPILLFVIGVYLLRGGEAIVDLAFPVSGENMKDQMGVWFILFMKLAGLVLMIYAIPKSFQIISNIIFVSSATSVGTDEQTKFIVHNLAVTVINLLLGLYLLRSGKIFYKLGFTGQKDIHNETDR